MRQGLTTSLSPIWDSPNPMGEFYFEVNDVSGFNKSIPFVFLLDLNR
jgi:hypothetical protein